MISENHGGRGGPDVSGSRQSRQEGTIAEEGDGQPDPDSGGGRD